MNQHQLDEWFIYTGEYYSVINKNEVIKFAGKWMELQIFILNEVTQLRKTNTKCFLSVVDAAFESSDYVHFIWNNQKEITERPRGGSLREERARVSFL